MTQNQLIERMLALLGTLEGHYNCACGRHLRVGVTQELHQTAVLLRATLDTDPDPEAITGEEGMRFALVEVDS